VEVRGPTLTLRYPRPADTEALFRAARDPEVSRFFSWSYERPEQAARWIDGAADRRAQGRALELVIDHRDHGTVGVTGLLDPVLRDRRATVGTWLGREQWGGGANTESKALIAALSFGPLGYERLSAYASTANARSQAALERLGFVREGVLRAWHRHGHEVHDSVVYGLLRADWEASPLRQIPAEVLGEPPAAFVVA
jgi:ribosomal-protein-alanine N-acetyltransferase